MDECLGVYVYALEYIKKKMKIITNTSKNSSQNNNGFVVPEIIDRSKRKILIQNWNFFPNMIKLFSFS